jgi:Uma2 family endonuclease
LVVEVDVTHRSLNKLPLYATIGVPEVWRFDSAHVILYRLSGETYQEVHTNVVLEGVTADDVLHFVQLAYELSCKALFFHIMQWAEGSYDLWVE